MRSDSGCRYSRTWRRLCGRAPGGSGCGKRERGKAATSTHTKVHTFTLSVCASKRPPGVDAPAP